MNINNEDFLQTLQQNDDLYSKSGQPTEIPWTHNDKGEVVKLNLHRGILRAKEKYYDVLVWMDGGTWEDDLGKGRHIFNVNIM